MAITINGDTGVSGVDGTVSNPALEGSDPNTGLYFPAADTVAIGTNGSERMRVDSSGNVGIGTSSPIDKLTVNGSISTNSSQSYIYSNGGSGTSVNSGFFLDGSGSTLRMFTGNSERMRIDSSGNVGIGTSSPGAQLQLTKSGTSDYTTFRLTNSGASGRTYEIGLGGNAAAAGYANNLYFYDSTASALRMVLDSSGNLLVGTTNSNPIGSNVAGTVTGAGGNVSISRDGNSALDLNRYTSDGTIARFYRSATQVGRIDVTTTATSYVTSSDYRLKENVEPLTTGLSTIGALKPVSYNWKSDNSIGKGFIAHELQAVIPDAVSGVKDAVDENGKIIPQGVDYSKIVVHLVAAIQELKAELDALKAKVGS